MDVSVSIALTIAGVLMIASELFLPGGILGIIGVLLMIASVWTGFSSGAENGFTIVIVNVVLLLVMIPLILKAFKHSPMILRSKHKTPLKQATESEYIGKRGKCLTDLHPTGKIEVEGKTLDVISSGPMIPTDAIVEIVEVSGNRIVVNEIT